MLEFGEGMTLVDEPLDQLRIIVKAGTQNLNRNAVLFGSIDSLKYVPRSTLADFANSLIS